MYSTLYIPRYLCGVVYTPVIGYFVRYAHAPLLLVEIASVFVFVGRGGTRLKCITLDCRFIILFDLW